MAAPSVVVTGFGAFHGVTDNPTAHLCVFLEQCGEEQLDGACRLVGRPKALTVATQDVHEWICGDLAALEEQLSSSEGPVVLVHLGVGQSGPFQLESTAWNNASFRCPDERGLMPQGVQIDQAQPLNCPECSTLPLEDICRELVAAGFPVEVSTDPGRFVCNYLYWCSSQFSKQRSGWYSLFIHVPPYATAECPVRHQQFTLAALGAVARGAAAACARDKPAA